MKFKNSLQKISRFATLGLVLLLVMLLIVQLDWFSGMQHRIQNNFYDRDSASDQIIIVKIDENSLGANGLGKLTEWKRDYYAQAIEALNEAGAAAIGIDITFPDPSNHGKEDDLRLQQALENNPTSVLAIRYYPQAEKLMTEWPNENLSPSSNQLGLINVQVDEDNFVRKLPLFHQTESGIVEAFSLTLARKYLNATPSNYAVQNGQFQFSDQITIPTLTQRDGDSIIQSMYVNYFATPYSFRSLSFIDLLNENWVDEKGQLIDFNDKIVLIGPTAIDLQDTYLSPVSAGVQMPGVEIHANAIQTLIENKFLRDQSLLALWLTLVLIVVINVSLFSFLKVRYALPIVVVEVFGFIVAGIVVYDWQVLMNVIYPTLMVLATFVGAYVMRFILEQKKRKFIEGAFGHYVNKSIVKQIQQNPDMLALGGTKREITVMFSDIANFTGLSEQMSPTELVSFLNEYLDEMTDIILKHNGTLDKYEGDAIMAFWNAPVAQHDPALNACLAALENQQKLATLRNKWANEGKPEIHIRIGLNTGDAVVGNVGSEDRFDYTAMGDNVNLGSRLEGVNKFYGTEILISEDTYKEVADHLVCREVDLIRVKGKQEPVRIFELQGKKGEVDEPTLNNNETFTKALTLYRAKNFDEAKKTFESLAEDPVAKVFVERCNEFITTPPANDWNGVWVFEKK